MALKVEGVVHRSLYGEEPLDRASGFEALHLPFASTHDLMRVLSPVVLAQALEIT